MNIIEFVKKHSKIIITAAAITATSAYSGFANNILAGNTISTTTEKSAVMEQKIETKIDQIINSLNLYKTDTTNSKLYLLNCCHNVQKYIIEHNKYDSSILHEVQSMSPKKAMTWQLYNATVNEKSVSLGNSLMFQKILEKLGIKVKIIGYPKHSADEIYAFNSVSFSSCAECFYNSTLETDESDCQKLIDETKIGFIDICVALNYHMGNVMLHSPIYHFNESNGQWEL